MPPLIDVVQDVVICAHRKVHNCKDRSKASSEQAYRIYF